MYTNVDIVYPRVAVDLVRSVKVRTRVPQYDHVSVQDDAEDETREIHVVEQLEYIVGEYVQTAHHALRVGGNGGG